MMAVGGVYEKSLSSTVSMSMSGKKIRLDNFEEITLIDPELNKSYIIRVSENDAERARNDMNFAASLLRYAQKLQQVADNHNNKENSIPVSVTPPERKMQTSQTAGTFSSQSGEYSEEQIEPEKHDCSVEAAVTEKSCNAVRFIPSPATSQSTPAESSTSTDITDATNTDAMHNWSKKETLLLISIYKENEDMFNDGKVSQKSCWNHVSKLLKQKGYNISGHKCSTKFQALKQTYKKIIDHNGKSGNQRKDWEYFEKVDELFRSKPWVSPLDTAGSNSNNFDESPEQPKRVKLTPANEFLKDLLKHKQERARTRDVQHDQKLEALSQLRDVMLKLLEKK